MKTQTKTIWFFVTLFIVSGLYHIAHADEKHRTSVVSNYSTEYNGTALSIAASQIHMDWSTNKLQGSLGTGTYNGSSAVSIGLGKRAGKVLINGSISTDGTNTGFGAGINFRF